MEKIFKILKIIYIFLWSVWLIYFLIPIIFSFYNGEDIYFNVFITQYRLAYFLILLLILLVYAFIIAILSVKGYILKIILLLTSFCITIFVTVIFLLIFAFEYPDPKIEHIDNKKYIIEVEHINFAKYKYHYYEEINWYSMKKVDDEVIKKLKG